VQEECPGIAISISASYRMLETLWGMSLRRCGKISGMRLPGAVESECYVGDELYVE